MAKKRAPRPLPPARAADPGVLKRASVAAPAVVSSSIRRAALRSLVPSTYSADGETHPYVRVYKSKWLSRLDFTSEANVRSLLLLSYLLLALGREAETENIVDQLAKHVDVQRMSAASRLTVSSALYVSAWLKTKRGEDAASLVARARELGRQGVHKDREWLSHEATAEIDDAVERRKIEYLAYPLAGIVLWLNDGGARTKAESLLAIALGAARALMAP